MMLGHQPRVRARRKEIRRNRLKFQESRSGKQERTDGNALAATGTGRPPISVALAKAPGCVFLIRSSQGTVSVSEQGDDIGPIALVA
jgi:hypothetical protein